jgi:hypothetical protein
MFPSQGRSDSDHMNPLPLKGGDRLGRRPCIGNERMDLVAWANEGRADPSKFAGIGNYDRLFGSFEHLAEDKRFIRLKRGSAPFCIHPGHTQENLVHVNIVEKAQRRIAGERKRPGPGNHPTGDVGANPGLIAQFHADVDRVCDDLYLFAMAQAAPHMRGGGAGRQPDGFAGLHKLRRCDPDPALFRRVPLLPRKKGAVIAKWLIQQRFDQFGAAMRAADQASGLKSGQVAPNTGRRRTCNREELFDSGAATAQKELDDRLGSSAEAHFVCHTWGFYRAQESRGPFQGEMITQMAELSQIFP